MCKNNTKRNFFGKYNSAVYLSISRVCIWSQKHVKLVLIRRLLLSLSVASVPVCHSVPECGRGSAGSDPGAGYWRDVPLEAV